MPRLKRPRWFPAFLAGFAGVVAGAVLRAWQETEPEPEAQAGERIVAAPPPPDDEELAAALGIHLPQPTIWPVVVGLGITLALAGIVTSVAFSVLGVLLLLWGIGGWIGNLRDEAKHGP